MKEKITQFDFDDAFKALSEIETPKVHGLKANRPNINESVKRVDRLELLLEDYYDIQNKDELNAAHDDREAEIAQAKLARIEKIVDLDAESEEDILPSYVGKVIIQCPQCMTLFYKNPEDIEHDEENPDVVNVNEVCQHCGNDSGYTLIGKVAADENTSADEAPVETEAPAEEEHAEEQPEENSEENKEENNEENNEEDQDLDLNLDLDFGQEEENKEEDKEEKKEESLNRSEFQKDCEKESELKTEIESEHKTLNEEKAECENDVCPDCGKEICECGKKLAENSSAVQDKLFAFADSLGESTNENIDEAVKKPFQESAKQVDNELSQEDIGNQAKQVSQEDADHRMRRFLDSVKVNESKDKKYSEEEIADLRKTFDISSKDFKKLINSPIFNSMSEDITEDLDSATDKVINDLKEIEAEYHEKVDDIIADEENSNSDIEADAVEAENIIDSQEIEEPVEEENFDDVDEIVDEALNNNISNYLTKVYENVKCFEAEECSFDGNKLIVEGKINFKSGNTKQTAFSFKKYKNRLIGCNEDFANGHAFSVKYSIKNNALLFEELAYRYEIDKNLVKGNTRK